VPNLSVIKHYYNKEELKGNEKNPETIINFPKAFENGSFSLICQHS
jgi:hypothetical protein